MVDQSSNEEELDRLRRFPEISRDELMRFFTLTDADELFARSHRGPANVLGVAVQLCTLPWLGFVPDEVHAVPPAVAPCRPLSEPADPTARGAPTQPDRGQLRGGPKTVCCSVIW
ncbi:hypothetical protein GCM10010174_02560 [Kutzneria viridogrisea]|uniref:DUF4158 domain-containing protein n=1 Tax=Kutzneria viridogrisea TaxID=47990 RepID=A0ABR6BDV5_9PSEU|nr:hypothetical protein [Kutzneria viridogrisea]